MLFEIMRSRAAPSMPAMRSAIASGGRMPIIVAPNASPSSASVGATAKTATSSLPRATSSGSATRPSTCAPTPSPARNEATTQAMAIAELPQTCAKRLNQMTS